MKSAVETLAPTRVRLRVEVPFDELRPALDAAYRKVAQQVRIKGFRPGKVPPRVLDQHVGRATVLQEAVNDAVPRFYADAVRDNQVAALGHPEVDVTEFADGEQLVFTAEVDVRPEFDLPDYRGLEVVVDDAEPADSVLDEQLNLMRERFAVLQPVQRAVEQGDFVSIDLAGRVDGQEVDDLTMTGLSYEVGSDRLVPGLDEALVGLSDGESATFPTTLRSGEQAGAAAEVTVTVRGVRVKDLPALDDEFAQTASEFDTLEELRADLRERLGRVARLTQGAQARDRVLEALLAKVDLPVPEHLLADEAGWRLANMREQLEQAGLTLDDYASGEGRTAADVEAEVRSSAEQGIRTQFVLDAIVRKEELSATEAELTEQILVRARRAGVPAEQLARQVVQNGQLPSLFTEVARNKAVALLLESARVTDTSGRPVDLAQLLSGDAVAGEPAPEDAGPAPADAPAGEGEPGGEHEGA